MPRSWCDPLPEHQMPGTQGGKAGYSVRRQTWEGTERHYQDLWFHLAGSGEVEKALRKRRELLPAVNLQ